VKHLSKDDMNVWASVHLYIFFYELCRLASLDADVTSCDGQLSVKHRVGPILYERDSVSKF
jgi:hypothetical protein